MRNKKYILCPLLLLSLILFTGNILQKNSYAQDDKTPFENYIQIKKIYYRWPGISLKMRMRAYLISLIGRKIQTECKFKVECSDRQLVCNLYSEKWLQIRGKINDEDLNILLKENPKLIKSWWRSAKLVSIEGVLKDFAYANYSGVNFVTLVLKDIRIKACDTGKDSKQQKTASH